VIGCRGQVREVCEQEVVGVGRARAAEGSRSFLSEGEEMKWRLLIALVAAISISLATGGQASAGPDSTTSATGVTDPVLSALIGNDDVFSTLDLSSALDPTGTTSTQHYGPYPSSSGDSGTCGPDWATDTFDRHFTVRSNGGGTFTVVEQFKNGSFVTMDGMSPAACDTTYTNHGHMLVAGKTGSMHGYFVIPNVGPQTSMSPYCNATTNTNANCDTTTFINTHFMPCYLTTCFVTTFFFHYAAGDQSLLFHEWKNASTDRGGNNGDIASS
jgi:hypothetical protein